MDRIFIESNEHLGLLYDRYCKLPEKISSLLDELEKINWGTYVDILEIQQDDVDYISNKYMKLIINLLTLLKIKLQI